MSESNAAALDANAAERILDELRWYGKTIGGGVPMIGTEKPGRTACTRWYKITLPLLYELNAVYGPPERVGCVDCKGNGFRQNDSTCRTCNGLGMIARKDSHE